MPSLLAAHLDLLVCPVCHGSLALAADVVACTVCHRQYPIVDGLPVLIASRALTLKEVSPAVPESASN
jgi:uncharacterized protein YbaR (Trm112 family)